MTGLDRINAVFDAAKREQRAAFMPYHAMGYPTRSDTLAMIKVLAENGADLFEIGIPHSDPLADGPTVQTATYAALTQGTTVADCLAMVRELRDAGVDTPFVGMSYMNPLFAYGLDKFVRDAVAAGMDGLIVPDLPPEEADTVVAACRDAGLATVFMLAPTSTEERIRLVVQHSTGFVYMVSVTGTTGARTELPPDLTDFMARVRKHTDLPLAIGFGIGTGKQAETVGKIANGVIVGSALVKAAGEPDGVEAIRKLGAELAAGAHQTLAAQT